MKAGASPYSTVKPGIDLKESKQRASSVASMPLKSIGFAEVPLYAEDLSAAFDEMIIATRSESLSMAMETASKSLFNADEVIMWTHSSSMKSLYSGTMSSVCRYGQGILGTACFSPGCENLSNPTADSRFDSDVDSHRATIIVPLRSEDGALRAVLQISRGVPFSEGESGMARAFAAKFVLYSHFLMSDDTISGIGAELMQRGDVWLVLTRLAARLRRRFLCRVVQFWCYTSDDGCFLKFNPKTGDFRGSVNNAGIVGWALQNEVAVNVPDVREHPEYSQAVDGSASESIMVLPFVHGGRTFALAMRGKESGGMFTAVDETHLAVFAPLVARSMAATIGSGEEGAGGDDVENSFAERLSALIDVAEIISGVMDVEVLVPTIMERACSLLATERCSVFLVDTMKRELVTQFQGGLDQKIRMPLDRGIVGHTATTGDIVNITDAYADPRFDKAVDLATGFRTRTILTVPIYNNRNEIAGVTEMINRTDGKVFDDDDISLLLAFNVFCGISLDNSKMYQVSLDLTRQLRGFVEMSVAMNESKKVHEVLEEILSNAMEAVRARRGTIFLRNPESDELNVFATAGEDVKGTDWAHEVVKARRESVFALVDDDGSSSGRALKRVESQKKACGSISNVLLDVESGPACDHICGFPLLTSDTKILGVMEFHCPGNVNAGDMKLLDCFAVFASVSLERSQLEEIAHLGHVEVELKQYVTAEERAGFTIPAKLRIPEEHNATIFTIHFDAPAWDGIGHFKVLWHIMNTFNLFEEFNVTNEKFFKFVSAISQTYNKVPYHNWRHAVDVTQFVTYELKITNFDQFLTKAELFGFIVAAICHDANHDGFTNVYNVKAETPLGILFKNQSVMETHHCQVAIEIMSKESCNLFSCFEGDEIRTMWSLVIQLILITDMAKHFDFLKKVNAACDEGPLDASDQETKIMMMQCVLKCGDISNVSRPFELADKWCDVLCEEFFRQGELEQANGMEYTSPLNDREHLDKPKSQIGFYTFVCLPLYQTAARVLEDLQANVDQVQSNLTVWKKATEDREKEAAAKAAAAAAAPA